MNGLGAYLRQARQKRNLTLRAVQQATGLSNPYLSQLENGRIKKPSPEVLHRLAKCYDLSYQHLLKLSGHPTSEPAHEEPPNASFRIGRFSDLTEEEGEKLTEYLDFLRSRRSEK